MKVVIVINILTIIIIKHVLMVRCGVRGECLGVWERAEAAACEWWTV